MLKPLLRRVMPFCAVVILGCGERRPEPQPVEGTLQYTDGAPVPGRAAITCHIEVDGKLYQARGVVQPDGQFRLTTFAPNDGAVVGEHGVSISPIPGGEEVTGVTVPERYASTETSGLTVTIEPGTNRPVLKIERPDRKK